MMTEGLPYSAYDIYDKGRFDCGLALFSGYDANDNPVYLDICYSDSDECHLGRDYTEIHRRAVEIFADDYDLTIIEEA